MGKIKTTAEMDIESDLAQQPPTPPLPLPTSSRIVLSRVQFRDVIDIPAIDAFTGTVLLDHENRTLAAFEFIYDRTERMFYLEKPKDPTWVPVMVPLENVKAMFPAKEK